MDNNSVEQAIPLLLFDPVKKSKLNFLELIL